MEQEAHAEEQSQDSSPEEASQETEEPSLPDFWEIDGEKVTIDQIREWRKGYLRMDDYTRKTQRLSEREREIRELEQRLQPLLQVERLLAANPHLYQALSLSTDRKSTRLNSSHVKISYAVFCLKKKKKKKNKTTSRCKQDERMNA